MAMLCFHSPLFAKHYLISFCFQFLYIVVVLKYIAGARKLKAEAALAEDPGLALT